MFEQVIEVPDRADIKHILRTHNAIASCMSGSGSAVYGIFSCEEIWEEAVLHRVQHEHSHGPAGYFAAV